MSPEQKELMALRSEYVGRPRSPSQVLALASFQCTKGSLETSCFHGINSQARQLAMKQQLAAAHETLQNEIAPLADAKLSEELLKSGDLVKYLADVMIPGAGVMVLVTVGCFFTGACELVPSTLTCLGCVVLVLAMYPELLIRNKRTLTPLVRERVAVIGLTGFIILMRIAMLCWEASLPVVLDGHGYSGEARCLMIQLFLMHLHIPERSFVFLSSLDSFLWTCNGLVLTAKVGEHAWMFTCWQLIVAAMRFLLVSGLRRLPMMALSESDSNTQKEAKQRVSAENERDIFLSYLMHEMRNPLSGTALLVFEFRESLRELYRIAQDEQINSETLRDSSKAEALRLRQLASFMATQIDKMRGVCDDVLQLEKIQKGKFEYQFVPMPLEEWMTRVVSQAAPLFAQASLEDEGGRSRLQRQRTADMDLEVKFRWMKDIQPEVQTLLSTHAVGVADFVRLEQVVSNFLSNAKKFTTRGSVRLRFEVRLLTEEGREEAELSKNLQGKTAVEFEKKFAEAETEKGPGKGEERGEGLLTWVSLRVCVIDTGAGLSEADRQKLFRPYAQVRAGELQNGGGTGLGLCICKSFVEAHAGGLVGAQSVGRGEGSTFFFQIFIPLLAGSSGKSLSPPPARRQSKITAPLYHPIVHSSSSLSSEERRASLISLLSEEAELNSEALIRALSPRAADSEPSRESSGPDLFAKTEEGGVVVVTDKTGSETAVGAGADTERLASSKQQETEKAGRESEQTDDHVNGEIGQSGEVSVALIEEQSEGGEMYSADVLLVDDDRFCLMAGSAALRRLGYSVRTAEDGEEACELVIVKKSSFRFVLMDKNMARMEGPEAIQRMLDFFGEKQTEKSGCIKTPRPFFIGCTGDATPEAITEFTQKGADRVLFKPLQPSKLREILGGLEEEAGKPKKQESTGE
uniref:histidine kinase n=1 Tax=Chromera velia CCMP2878 TaxID=1169474 RepID=A0A0G4HD46_9ALVE|eukprot:Cvel_6324.t1-p1 / transcript=Cvel_6324.t1 / gene=Cvel_6324 / organism=Chromera_velia_CCMP2878 / gene_product=Sensor histidine kinase AruS, putative / transcript_product=Sensor histidine kinase AruS, putative / location=Cvel_scaffold307:18324-23227(-) / protein_length=916 / sequence_SO=supercontig / SO=protein_coding / is_pseudo=false